MLQQTAAACVSFYYWPTQTPSLHHITSLCTGALVTFTVGSFHPAMSWPGWPNEYDSQRPTDAWNKFAPAAWRYHKTELRLLDIHNGLGL